MPATVMDLHVHTTFGASDSQLHPDDLAQIATGIGLNGFTLTEHDRVWERHILDGYRSSHVGLIAVPAMEVSTELGHILTYGLPHYISGIRRASELRRVADQFGAFLVVAHPFRHWFDPVMHLRAGKEPPEMVAERLSALPVFQLVDGVEVLNGANTERENRIALEVALHLGKPGTGGSDAHSRSGIGIFTTVFEQPVDTLPRLVAEMHAGRFHAARGLPEGNLRRYTLNDAIEAPAHPDAGRQPAQRGDAE